MGKLNSSLILRYVVVNAGRNPFSFYSSFSSSVKKSISGSGKGKKYNGLETVDDALIVFNKMIVSYNTMINGYCKVKRLDEAMELFHEISRKGPIPNKVTYNTLMQSMFRLGRVSTACEFLRKMLASGQVPDIVTCSILLDGLYKTGKLEEALNKGGRLIERNNDRAKPEGNPQ
ncbi:hypothetical protein V6N13_121663 [Hibiscus sabdariffa]